MAELVPAQKCPNCNRSHDVSVYVTGQKVRCSCGLSFTVRREDGRTSFPASQRSTLRGTESTVVRPLLDAARLPVPDPKASMVAAAAAASAASAVVPAGAVQQPSPPPVPAPAPTLPPSKPIEGLAAPIAQPPPPPLGPAAGTPSTKPDKGQPGATTAVIRRPEVPGYELLEMLGKGGMGEVWRARQLSLGRTVAIKILAPELAADPEFVQRFEKEAAALAALSHPNIVQIIDRGANPATRTFFFAMELCEGQSLRELITLGKLSLADRMNLVAQIGHAIAYAHGRGVIHRDLKPENILVVPERTAKVVDFGLAGMRRQDQNLALTRAATAMGTLHYMAPEQRRDARSVDERADVYSLGIILYEMLTGDIPMGRFKLPSEKVPGLDTRLDKIVSKALEPEPEARYASAHDMTVELELVTRAAPMLATVVEPESKRPARPSEVALGEAPGLRAKVAAFLVVFAVLAVAALYLWNQRAGDKADPAVAKKAMPADTNGSVGVTVSKKGTDFLDLEFGFTPGDAVFSAGSGEWKVEGDALVAKVFGGPRPYAVYDGPALLAGDMVLTTTVTLDPTPPAGRSARDGSRAEAYLRGENGAHLGVGVVLGARPAYVLSWRLPGTEVDEERWTRFDEKIPPPVPGQPVRMRLTAESGEVSVYVGDEPMKALFKKKLDYKQIEGNVAVSCVEATCRFEKLLVAGRPSKVEPPPVEGK
ncbi:MAG: serine/threonine-protein kinase [Myxococcales bacterium]